MTRQQTRAKLAFEDVEKLAEKYGEQDPRRKSYGSIAHKLPVLIRNAGLCQALHFLDSRQKEGKASSASEMPGQLLDHLAVQLTRVDASIIDRKSLLARARSAELPTYLRLSREAIETAAWYARLAQSVLGVVPGEDPSTVDDATEGAPS